MEGCYWIVSKTVGENSPHTKPGPELVNKKETGEQTNTSKEEGPAERRYSAPGVHAAARRRHAFHSLQLHWYLGMW